MSQDAPLESLTGQELGLPNGARMPLRFVPGQTWSPLLVSFPHIGLSWPHDLRPKPQADFGRNADFEVQAVYPELAAMGVASVSAIYSRLVVDLNRAADDVSPLLVPDHPSPNPRRRPGSPDGEAPTTWDRPGQGVVWASAVSTGAGSAVRILEPPLSYPAFAKRIELFHAPYYNAIKLLLERRKERFGYAILLDAHSMPSTVGVDLVLGTLDGSSCSPTLSDVAFETLRRASSPGALLSVRRDTPYRGGEIVRAFGRPERGVHAFQVEINRRLYMDERTYTLFHPLGAAGSDPLESAGSPPDPRSDLSMGRNLGTVPSRRRARELADLMRRVDSLVQRLCATRPDQH